LFENDRTNLYELNGTSFSWDISINEKTTSFIEVVFLLSLPVTNHQK